MMPGATRDGHRRSSRGRRRWQGESESDPPPEQAARGEQMRPVVSAKLAPVIAKSKPPAATLGTLRRRSRSQKD